MSIGGLPHTTLFRLILTCLLILFVAIQSPALTSASLVSLATLPEHSFIQYLEGAKVKERTTQHEYTDAPERRADHQMTVDPLIVSEVAKLQSTDIANGDLLGYSVAVSGKTTIVGALEKNSFSGAAYIFERNQTGTWTQIVKLQSSDIKAGDRFGLSVGISGDRAIVGATFKDGPGLSSGAAYVFDRNQSGTNNWGQVAKLQPSDIEAGDSFGISVAISGDTAVVGAHQEDDPGSDSGAAYVFERNQGGANKWGQTAKLQSSDIADRDIFGYSVAVSGDTVVVGAPGKVQFTGAAYIFNRNQGGTNNWGQVAKLQSTDLGGGDNFGWSVAISVNTAIVGARYDDDFGPNSGAAYVFERDESGTNRWGQSAKLWSPEGKADDNFGTSVAIDNDKAIVGAPREDDPGSDSGAAYIFERNRGGVNRWSQVAKLQSSDIEPEDYFGFSVAISSDSAIVGAHHEDVPGLSSGAAYIFPGRCFAGISLQTSPYFNKNGGIGSVAVIIEDNCAWTATGNANWIIITSGSSGIGNGSVSFLVAPSSIPRTGTITVAGRTFTVYQTWHSITGRITTAGNAMSGIAVTLSGSQTGSTQTDTNGNYAFPDLLSAGSYTVAPTKVGYNFLPPSQTFNDLSANQTANFTAGMAVTGVSAASFVTSAIAVESIVAAFGGGMATTTQIATTIPLPTKLADTVVKIKDVFGVERDAPLFFVSPNQINFLVPPNTKTGPATITITSANNIISIGTLQINTFAPSLFTANSDGQGVAAATVLRVKADGSLTYEPVAQFDSNLKRWIPKPIDLGPGSDQVFLLMFGTGIRYRSSLSEAAVKIGGINAEVLFAGAQGDFVGLDQVNVRLPRTLTGRGEVDIELASANKVKIGIK